jgi:hypothetical protein
VRSWYWVPQRLPASMATEMRSPLGRLLSVKVLCSSGTVRIVDRQSSSCYNQSIPARPHRKAHRTAEMCIVLPPSSQHVVLAFWVGLVAFLCVAQELVVCWQSNGSNQLIEGGSS